MQLVTRLIPLFGILVIISILVQPAAASYSYSRTDYQYDYLIGPNYLLDQDEDPVFWDVYSSLSIGKTLVSGEVGYQDTCVVMLIGMRFQATESGDIYFGAAWTIDYKIQSGLFLGLAFIDIHYVLKDDSDNTLESEWVTKYQPSTGTTITGSDSFSVQDDEHFSTNLAANTYYRIYVEVKYWIGWYSSIHRDGSDNCAFDVSNLCVSTSPI